MGRGVGGRPYVYIARESVSCHFVSSAVLFVLYDHEYTSVCCSTCRLYIVMLLVAGRDPLTTRTKRLPLRTVLGQGIGRGLGLDFAVTFRVRFRVRQYDYGQGRV